MSVHRIRRLLGVWLVFARQRVSLLMHEELLPLTGFCSSGVPNLLGAFPGSNLAVQALGQEDSQRAVVVPHALGGKELIVLDAEKDGSWRP